MNRSSRAIFLDRDGVINKTIVLNGKPYPPKNLQNLKILPGVKKTLETLHNKGWLLIVVSNQPDVARGITSLAKVEEINRYLKEKLPIDDFRICYHDNNDGCSCRKPLPGLLIDAAKTYGINLGSSFMIGDRWSDIEAGKLAGCKTIFIDYKYREKQPIKVKYRINSIKEAVKIILGK
jgi:D-glycero-D-manno-heptose 1,7-bisphosphate phosphatase